MKNKFINEELIKIIISAVLFIFSFLVQENSVVFFVLLILSYLIVSYEMIIEAVKNLFKGEFFDENTLMIIATIGAFCIREYPEAVMVILLFQLGEYLSDLAVDRSKDAVTELMDLRSDQIRILENGTEIIKNPQEAKLDDLFIVKPGEKIPLDGIVTEGNAYLDTSSLTGESVPRLVQKGDSVLSGTVCNDQILTIRATSVYETSTASKILSLLENSSDKKANTEKFITKFSKIYTPIVVLLAVFITIIPLFFGMKIHDTIYTALVFLVMSCPCALVLSVPLAFFCGIGRASREGVLVKGANELEKMGTVDTILFDKTGTITKGVFEISEIVGISVKKQELLELAAYGELNSHHPIAKSILKKYKKPIDSKRISNFKEIRGMGIEVKIDHNLYLLGNASLLNQHHIDFEEIPNVNGTIVYIADKNKLLGYLIIADEIKKNVRSSILALSKIGLKRMIIVSGDHEKIVKSVSEKVGIQHYYADLLPEDKVRIINQEKETGTVAFVGDGINDAPVIQSADIGIAMGGIGSDAAIEASDIVLMHDDLYKLVDLIKISRLTKKLVLINIAFALLVKLTVLVLGIFGYSTVWMAVFADVGVTILCVLNTLQILKRKLR